MSRISRIVVLVTAVASLVGVMSATAGAVTWHNDGATAFTATGGAGTLSSTGVTLGCTSATGTGTLGMGPFVTHTLTVSGTVTFNGCLLSNIATSVDCGYTLTGTTAIAGTNPTVTTGNVDVTCDVIQFGTKICHVENHNPSLHGEYRNPIPGTQPGRLTVTTGILRVTNPTGGSCPLGNGDTAHLTHQSFTITNPANGGPFITRTP